MMTWSGGYINWLRCNRPREQVTEKAQDHQQRIKEAFVRKERKEDFQLGDLVLKWYVPI
jgi:hypothetical protein